MGAISNGVELLGEEDPDFMRDAIALIGQSARTASRRLQFYRFAYGTAAASGAPPSTVRELVDGLCEGTKLRCDWAAEAATLPVDWQRLACNMLVLAGDALPRGGTVLVRPLRAGQSGIEVTAEGEAISVTPELRAALEPDTAAVELTSRTVQGYFAARLADQLGARLALVEADARRALFRAAES